MIRSPTGTSGQETWSEPRQEGLAEVGPQSDSDPVSLTEDMPDLCSPLFPDRHGQGRLGTTDQDACSVWARGAGGADKVRRSSQPQYRGPYPVMPCAPARRCRQAMSDGHNTACQTRQSTNSIVDAVVCRPRRTLCSLPGHEQLGGRTLCSLSNTRGHEQ